jgi:hypothetical protein
MATSIKQQRKQADSVVQDQTSKTLRQNSKTSSFQSIALELMVSDLAYEEFMQKRNESLKKLYERLDD